MKKKMLVLALAGIMAISSLTGCKSVKTVDSEEVLMTVNGEEVTAGVANFYARYTQAQYETLYGAYVGDNMWSTEAEEGVTYEEYVKNTVLETLQIMVLSEQHMADYGVELTDEEKALITKAAKEFDNSNAQESKEMISGDPATVERYMTLQVESQKVMEAISESMDVEISDEEAAQKKMEYVFFSYDTTDEDGKLLEVSDDEKKALKEKAEAIAADVENGEDFKKAAEKAEATVEVLTFDADSFAIDAEMIEAADALKEGEVSGLIETESGIYIGKLVSLFDRAATEAKKTEMLAQLQSEEYVAICEQWVAEAEIDVKEDVWANIDFEELQISMIRDETAAYADEVVTDDVAE